MLLLKTMMVLFELFSLMDEQPVQSSVTISYSINVVSKIRNRPLSELYDGAVKVLYLTRDSIQVRQVSLLRNETVVLVRDGKTYSGRVAREAGKMRSGYSITQEEWLAGFPAISGNNCRLEAATIQVEGYTCRKAILLNGDGSKIIAYYTTSLQHPAYSIAEPLFTCLPGIVLKYEVHSRESVLTYAAHRIRVR